MPNTPKSFSDVNEEIQKEILSNLLHSQQFDRLYISVTSLSDMSRAGDLDIFLDQTQKSEKQKILYVQKVINDVISEELKASLSKALSEYGFDYFFSKNLSSFLAALQKTAEAIRTVRLEVAVDFKEKDLKEMANVVSNKLKCPIALDITINKDIIGGAIIQYGTYISDYSLKTRLMQFRTHWHRAVSEEHNNKKSLALKPKKVVKAGRAK